MPSPSEAAPWPPHVEFSDRVTMLGLSGRGKSTLMRSLYRQMAPPRLSIDPVGSLLTAVPGAVTFSDPTRIPPGPDARFVPRDPLDLDAYGALYATARDRVIAAIRSGDPYYSHLWTWCDEAGMVMPATRTPPDAAAVVIGGRKLAMGHGAAHVRAREMHRSLIAQAQHIALFPLPLEDDRRYVAGNLQIQLADLEAAMNQIPDDTFGCTWWDGRHRTLTPTILEAT